MTTILTTAMNKRADDAAMVALLGKLGSATIEDAMDRLAMNWEQVFSVVDRLSRSGAVRLTRVGAEYYIEKGATA